MAFALARSLKRQGYAVQRVERGVSAAFGTDWNTLRRWEEMARKGLGDEKVDFILASAEAGNLFPAFNDWCVAEVMIHVAGNNYRRRQGLNLQDLNTVTLQRYSDMLARPVKASDVEDTNQDK